MWTACLTMVPARRVDSMTSSSPQAGQPFSSMLVPTVQKASRTPLPSAEGFSVSETLTPNRGFGFSSSLEFEGRARGWRSCQRVHRRSTFA